MEANQTYIGVDVGTTSARAAIFDHKGTMLAKSATPITVFRPKADHYEHSSEEIWKSVCSSVQNVLKKSRANVANVRGVGFDATCSLVVLGQNDQPLTVSVTGSPEQNVIVWMDHRAIEEAHTINATKHKVLKYVGNVISPEMQTPKLLWLKKHLPNTWKNAVKFMDLPDFLSYRATGVDVRSLCSVVCKWTFQEHNKPHNNVVDALYGWDDTYFRQIGLEDLADEGYVRIGRRVARPGERIAGGLTEKAAAELGLRPHTPVAVSMIDAHAGGIGTLGAPLKADTDFVTPQMLEERMAYIAGTSACHMACSREPKFIDGIWGPYYQAMIPDMWLSEGGESAVGALIDSLIERHTQSIELKNEAEKCYVSIYELLNNKIRDLTEVMKLSHHSLLTKDIHILPYFHGNRSPRADPTLRGMICGLTLTDSLPVLYLAALQAVAYGTKHIIQEMNNVVVSVSASLHLCAHKSYG